MGHLLDLLPGHVLHRETQAAFGPLDPKGRDHNPFDADGVNTEVKLTSAVPPAVTVTVSSEKV